MHVRRRGREGIPAPSSPNAQPGHTAYSHVSATMVLKHTQSKRSAGRRAGPTKVQRGRRRPTPHFCQTTNAARARYIRVPAVLLSKDKRCLFLCVACMHRRAQQCPTMPRHVELLVYCFSPFQTRRLGECHPLDTPARVGFTKTPLSDAYASEPG